MNYVGVLLNTPYFWTATFDIQYARFTDTYIHADVTDKQDLPTRTYIHTDVTDLQKDNLIDSPLLLETIFIYFVVVCKWKE